MRLLYCLALLLLALNLVPRPGAAAPLPPRRLPPGGQLAVGLDHTLLLRADGTLYAWGRNSDGPLGTGTTTNSAVPVAVAPGAIPTGVRLVQVAAGSLHSLALGSNGLVYAWGSNSNGQLGDGTYTTRTTPIAVSLPAGVRIVQVVAGYQHSLALAADGTAYAWGSNQYGQLGNNSLTTSRVPVAVVPGGMPAGTQLVQVAAGHDHCLVLAANGTAYAWGRNNYGQLGNSTTATSLVPVAVAQGALPAGTRLTQVAAGGYHNLALAADGTAYGWGSNGSGQLGNTTSTDSSAPVAVAQGALPANSQLVQLIAGSNHSLALTADGLAYAWGSNYFGQVGNNTSGSAPVLAPVPVLPGAMPSGTRLAQLAAGSPADHSLALAADGTAYAWGFGSAGQLGNGASTQSSLPVAPSVPGRVSGYQQVAAGNTHSLALHANGSAYAWGRNSESQLGSNSSTSSLVPVAVAQGALPAGMPLRQVAAGGAHSVALAADGLAYAWGFNGDGRLGTGSSGPSSSVPVAVAQGALPAGSRLVQVAAGTFHTVALAADGTAYAWGGNANGQLGTGSSSTNTLVPTAVAQGAMPTGTRLVQVAVGGDHSLALAADGTAYAWGRNDGGQLGTGTTTTVLVPVVVAQGALPGGTRLVQVAAGVRHSLALAADGTAYAWGRNDSGQLGNGSSGTSAGTLVPVAVAMPAGVRFVQVAAGATHSLALAADGTLYAWGDNQYGQLGINSFSNSPVPVAEVSGTAQWTALAAGPVASHSLAIGPAAAVYSAGYNNSGQLGDNTTTNSPIFLRNRVALPVQASQPTTGLALYPNPAPGGAATLTGAAPRQAVQVLDALGRQVATATADATGTATLGGLAPGLYVVRAGSTSVRLAVE